jgi:hypothetical protein
MLLQWVIKLPKLKLKKKIRNKSMLQNEQISKDYCSPFVQTYDLANCLPKQFV